MEMQNNNAIQAALDFKTSPSGRRPTSALVRNELLSRKFLTVEMLADRLDYSSEHPINVALYKLRKKGLVERVKSSMTGKYAYRLITGTPKPHTPKKWKSKSVSSADPVATMEAALEIMNESFAEFKKAAKRVAKAKKAIMEMEG